MVLLRREPAVGVWDCIWTIDEMQANKVVKGLLFVLHVIYLEKGVVCRVSFVVAWGSMLTFSSPIAIREPRNPL